MRHSFFYPSAVGFLTGVLIRSIYSISIDLVVFIFITSGVLIIYTWMNGLVFERKEIKLYSIVFLTLVLFCSFGIGGLAFAHASQFKGDKKLHEYVEEKIKIHGIIISEADEREKGRRFRMMVLGLINNQNRDTIRNTNIILTDGLYSHIQYGDEVVVEGILVEPEDFETNNGRIFKYRSYLAKDNIFFEIENPEMEVIAHHKASKVKEVLFSIKDNYVEKIDRVVPYPQSTLAAGITIAGKKALPPSIEEEFQRTGTLQIVVLSGYNITIVADAFMSVTRFLPAAVSASVGGMGIILFTIMAGGSATVVRGSIMSCIVICTRLFKTRYDVLRALTIAAVVMVIVNPYVLVFDPSFQLSFLATLGLIFVSPMVEKHLMWISERFNLRQITAASIATQLFVTPFLLYVSGEISIVALPANLLITLCMPLTMLFSFMAGMLTFIHVFLAVPAAYVSYLLLGYELFIVHIFSSISFALVHVSHFPWWVMLMVYNSFAVFIWRFYNKEIRLKMRHTTDV